MSSFWSSVQSFKSSKPLGNFLSLIPEKCQLQKVLRARARGSLQFCVTCSVWSLSLPPLLSGVVARFTNAARHHSLNPGESVPLFLISPRTAARFSRFPSLSPLSLSLPLSSPSLPLFRCLALTDQKLTSDGELLYPGEAAAHPCFSPVRPLILLLPFFTGGR